MSLISCISLEEVPLPLASYGKERSDDNDIIDSIESVWDEAE